MIEITLTCDRCGDKSDWFEPITVKTPIADHFESVGFRHVQGITYELEYCQECYEEYKAEEAKTNNI